MSTKAANVERPAANKTLLFSSFAVCVSLSFTVCSFTGCSLDETESQGAEWVGGRDGRSMDGEGGNRTEGRSSEDRQRERGSARQEWRKGCVSQRLGDAAAADGVAAASRRRGKRLVGRGPAAGRRRFRGQVQVQGRRNKIESESFFFRLLLLVLSLHAGFRKYCPRATFPSS